MDIKNFHEMINIHDILMTTSNPIKNINLLYLL